MKKKLLIFTYLLFSFTNMFSQNIFCGTKEENDYIYSKHPESINEKKEFEKSSMHFKNINNATYTIPVVFHIYGNIQNSKTVTYDKIVNALSKLNEDFKGQNNDFNSVYPIFTPIKGTLDIEFKLAKRDPNGNCTTGVIFHNVQNGFGNGGGYDLQIQEDAWDNYKYMNVYIQADLYNNGVTNNSGVAWYPNTWMSDNNLARVVYNGQYLFDNTNSEFASVLTHEFGHFLNLIHTFEGGCSGTDEVTDTPNEDGNHSIGCTLGTNCGGNYVNNENYMGYNGASGCYKMFTQGQISRMIAGLQHPTRFPLWQNQNLIDTGVAEISQYIYVENDLNIFKEVLNNDGSFSVTHSMLLSTNDLNISSGVLTAGQFSHNLPAGLTPQLAVVSNSKISISLVGNAINHNLANNQEFTISLSPNIFNNNGSNYYCKSVTFKLDFYDPFGIYYVDIDDQFVNSSVSWDYFTTEIPSLNNAYGCWIYDNNKLKLETYGKKLICNGSTPNITKLGYNFPVNGTSNFVAPANYPGQLDIYNSNYTTWLGDFGYVGFEYFRDNLPCYGWFKAEVSADGSSFKITEYSYNTQPYGTIYTPNILSSPSFNSNYFKIYPNPVIGNFTIEHKNQIDSFQIYDSQGKMVLSSDKLFDTNVLEINIAFLSTGTYYIKFMDIEGGIYESKILKE